MTKSRQILLNHQIFSLKKDQRKYNWSRYYLDRPPTLIQIELYRIVYLHKLLYITQSSLPIL